VRFVNLDSNNERHVRGGIDVAEDGFQRRTRFDGFGGIDVRVGVVAAVVPE
jgi:hypothetical protein